MSNTNKKPFEPVIIDTNLAGDAIHPSEHLIDELEYRQLSNQEFASKMEMDIDFINHFLKGKNL